MYITIYIYIYIPYSYVDKDPPPELGPETSPQVLSFAREHFVTVVPVIETPGHILAALAAYPEHPWRSGVPTGMCCEARRSMFWGEYG